SSTITPDLSAAQKPRNYVSGKRGPRHTAVSGVSEDDTDDVFRSAGIGVQHRGGAPTCFHPRYKGCNVIGTLTNLYGRDDLVAGNRKLSIVALKESAPGRHHT
ncbi:hypothetical protein R3Q06_33445, partial [Rhodococcus erythropolis]|uniref:hypothetical protein n=1 Tax=Rhodococcus erythropolis TaxID=1833 RepID=UPI00294A99B8